MRFISFIATVFISLPLGGLALSLALSNREVVAWRLWPLERVFDVQAGALAASLLGLGFLAGAAFVSLFAQKTRYRLWQQDRRVARLEADLKIAEAKVPGETPAAAPVVPSPTQKALRDVETAPSAW